MGALTTLSAVPIWTIIFTNIGLQTAAALWATEDKLFAASRRGDEAEVRRLTGDQGTDVNKQIGYYKETPLFVASRWNHKQVVKLLLSCNADPNIPSSYGMTPLMVASRFADVDVVNDLLAAHPIIDWQDKANWTALMMASRYNRSESVKTLITAGAQLNLKQKNGVTALMLASRRDNLDVVKILIKAGADIDLQANDGYTALMRAVAYTHNDETTFSHLNMTITLLDYGADMNIQDNDGMTALHWAVEHNREEMVITLLQHGANARIKSNTGDTAVDIARNNGFMDILQLINQYTHKIKLRRGLIIGIYVMVFILMICMIAGYFYIRYRICSQTDQHSHTLLFTNEQNR